MAKVKVWLKSDKEVLAEMKALTATNNNLVDTARGLRAKVDDLTPDAENYRDLMEMYGFKRTQGVAFNAKLKAEIKRLDNAGCTVGAMLVDTEAQLVDLKAANAELVGALRGAADLLWRMTLVAYDLDDTVKVSTDIGNAYSILARVVLAKAKEQGENNNTEEAMVSVAALDKIWVDAIGAVSANDVRDHILKDKETIFVGGELDFKVHSSAVEMKSRLLGYFRDKIAAAQGGDK